MNEPHYDVAVIGSGPGGQKAAIQAVKAGRRTVLIEKEPSVGGACIHYGTIPSKALRHTALRVSTSQLESDIAQVQMHENLELPKLMGQVERVVSAHSGYMANQIERNGIDRIHGKARFRDANALEVRSVRGQTRAVTADFVVIATGSRPRTPVGIPVDHEHILDSDSILSMAYLPTSLVVLGAGVIASEYASIFSQLGVQVTMVDKADRPLRFLDEEMTRAFSTSFESAGARFLGERTIESVVWDGLSQVEVTLAGGEVLRAEKVLVALGRSANVEELDIAAAGIPLTERGLIEVDDHCQTAVPNIYAVGDVIGPPALASTSMEQGRRAVCHAIGIDPGHPPELSPMGIFTIPELASVGLSEAEARRRHGDVIVGRARYDELARGQISGISDGLLKLVADPDGIRPLGVHIIGEGATEIIHLGQMALLAGWEVDEFVENIFAFPTLAEAYRIAAFDVAEQRQSRTRRLSA